MEFNAARALICVLLTACRRHRINANGDRGRIISLVTADIFLAGGSEASIVEIGLQDSQPCKALSTRTTKPERDSGHSIVIATVLWMSEGAGVVVVEELEHAKAAREDLLRLKQDTAFFRGRLPHNGAAPDGQAPPVHATRARARPPISGPGRLL